VQINSTGLPHGNLRQRAPCEEPGASEEKRRRLQLLVASLSAPHFEAARWPHAGL